MNIYTDQLSELMMDIVENKNNEMPDINPLKIAIIRSFSGWTNDEVSEIYKNYKETLIGKKPYVGLEFDIFHEFLAMAAMALGGNSNVYQVLSAPGKDLVDNTDPRRPHIKGDKDKLDKTIADKTLFSNEVYKTINPRTLSRSISISNVTNSVVYSDVVLNLLNTDNSITFEALDDKNATINLDNNIVQLGKTLLIVEDGVSKQEVVRDPSSLTATSNWKNTFSIYGKGNDLTNWTKNYDTIQHITSYECETIEPMSHQSFNIGNNIVSVNFCQVPLSGKWTITGSSGRIEPLVVIDNDINGIIQKPHLPTETLYTDLFNQTTGYWSGNIVTHMDSDITVQSEPLITRTVIDVNTGIETTTPLMKLKSADETIMIQTSDQNTTEIKVKTSPKTISTIISGFNTDLVRNWLMVNLKPGERITIECHALALASNYDFNGTIPYSEYGILTVSRGNSVGLYDFALGTFIYADPTYSLCTLNYRTNLNSDPNKAWTFISQINEILN